MNEDGNEVVDFDGPGVTFLVMNGQLIWLDGDGVPHVQAERIGDHLRVLCPNCGDWHYHDLASVGKHVMGHCADPRLKSIGYVVLLQD